MDQEPVRRPVIGALTVAHIFSAAAVYLVLYLGAMAGSQSLAATATTTIGLPVAFVLLTAAWVALARTRRTWPIPEPGLIVGLFAFIPLFFVIFAPLFSRQPMTLRDAREGIFWLYIVYPISVIEISTYSGLLPSVLVSPILVVITGLVMRFRARHRA